MTVNDYTGSGNGWNTTITSTQFTTGGSSPHTLSTSASTATGVTSSCNGGATCKAPTNSITYLFVEANTVSISGCCWTLNGNGPPAGGTQGSQLIE